MKQNSKGRTRTIVFTILGMFLGIFLGYGIVYKFPRVINETVTKIERDITVTDEGIADAVDKVYNSVVVVTNYKDDKAQASGSGFVYKNTNDHSYIITNHHVIADGNKFEVTYTDGTVVTSELIGSDQYSDIAILKVEKKDDTNQVVFGKTNELRVGDTTFTVGAPLDFTYSWTVTRGIISGKERHVEVSLSNAYGDDYVMNVIQTDAAVNSGNSGGPLCNSNGEVIGVINAKIKSTGVEGMGFAIPIETAVEKAEQIIEGESTDYPFLGISMASVEDVKSEPKYNKYFDSETVKKGVMVIDVQKNSAAESAKLKTGDVIIKINDATITNVAFLRYELYKYKIGDNINVTYIREGKEYTVSVKLTSKLPVT